MLYGFIYSINCISLGYRKPTPVAMPSKALVCSRLTPVIAGSNLAEGIRVRLFCLLCVVQVAVPACELITRSGVLPGVCLTACDLEISTGRPRPDLGCRATLLIRENMKGVALLKVRILEQYEKGCANE